MPTIISTSDSCGITYTEPSGNTVYLPLEQLDVHAEIVDTSATVSLTQTFWQCSSSATPRARYVFPVPAQAAVCGFKMRTEDGRVIVAVVKEKEVARKEHEQAIETGRMTGLVEYIADDVFSISLGCLPQHQLITTKLTYVMDLMEDDFVDQIRFQLPVCVGMRYGNPPSDIAAAKTIPADRIKIAVDVFMKGPIQSITSPTHPTFELCDQGARFSSARVAQQAGRYHSPSFMSADFVLSIKSEGINAPRCFAERDPSGTVAMQLTVVPQFKFAPIPAQEYIFLVDRSGSMGYDRIETAKRGLVMLLRSLPSQGTSFNILSFGSEHTSLWPESKVYNEQTLVDATRHVDSMAADYGGTNIRAALEFMFRHRQQNIPTSCFVLTDGEAWDIDQTIVSVTNAVSQAKADAALRVFTLGIGETTSSALCNGIARAGNGICLMAAASEAIIAKCSKLVKASRAEIMNNISVDWHAPSPSSNSPVTTSSQENVVLHQAPKSLPPLYSGVRFVTFAVIKHEQFEIPQEVVVQATRSSTGEQFKFTVPVEVIDRADESGSGPQRPLIHTLAARRVIMDLEDGEQRYVSPAVQETIVHLGEQYQLASRFTSFIAVEGPDQETLDPAPLTTSAADELEESDDEIGGCFDDWGGSSYVHLQPAGVGRIASPSRSESPMAGCAWEPPSPTTSDVEGAIASPADPPRDDVERLVRLQSFDGSFPVSEELVQILGHDYFAQAQTRQVDEKVWATALAIVYLQKHLRTQPELLEGLVEKATAYIEQVYGRDFSNLLQAAHSLVP